VLIIILIIIIITLIPILVIIINGAKQDKTVLCYWYEMKLEEVDM